MSSVRPAKDAAQPALVSLSAVTWDFALVGRTRMLTEAWLRAGQPTTFVQVPSYRTALQRLTPRRRPDEEVSIVRPWPVFPARFWPHVNYRWLRRAISRRAAGLRRELSRQVDFSTAAAIVVSPVWAPWLEALPFRHIVYDCIDDVAVHTPQPALAGLYRRWEDELVQRATAAVVTARPLLEGLQPRRPGLPATTIRNGVDVERFQSLAASSPRPADLPNGQRPIIGFIGALYDWIDWKLIAAATRALPECDFVLVGPYTRSAASDMLERLGNVRLLGPRPYRQVPAYVQAFDVCWVPFNQSRVSRAANPVKIYEYLALGKPVVSTPVADTDSFGAHVRVGADPGEIIDHLRAALGDAGRDADERVRFAQANSWASRAADYVSFIGSLPG